MRSKGGRSAAGCVFRREGRKFMILVLSATGAPVPLVERFLVDMTVPCVGWVEYFLAGPGRGADHVAETLSPDERLLAGEHIGFDVAKGRLGLAVDPHRRGVDDLFREVGRTRGERGGRLRVRRR